MASVCVCVCAKQFHANKIQSTKSLNNNNIVALDFNWLAGSARHTQAFMETSWCCLCSCFVLTAHSSQHDIRMKWNDFHLLENFGTFCGRTLLANEMDDWVWAPRVVASTSPKKITTNSFVLPYFFITTKKTHNKYILSLGSVWIWIWYGYSVLPYEAF